MFYIRRFFYRAFSWFKRHRNIKPKNVMKCAKRVIAEHCEYDCGIYFTAKLDKIQNDYLLLRSDDAGFCNCGQYLYGADIHAAAELPHGIPYPPGLYYACEYGKDHQGDLLRGRIQRRDVFFDCLQIGDRNDSD